jgi:ABC-2 type transport system ATP-binding protein
LSSRPDRPAPTTSGLLISVRGLVREYRVHERAAGLAAALRSLYHRPFRTIRAVDGISFDIGLGERVGFLGPNGAGKTTTLKMLAGLLHPTAGSVQVLGWEPRRRDSEFLRSITLVTGQKQQLLWDLPPQDTFELNRAIYSVSRPEFRRTVDELVSLLDLGALIRKPTRQLSLGERMKCELAAALIHCPKVLFLDEPTIGLDVNMQGIVRRFIRSYNERHRATVILTSHYMDDVLAITPRVVVIDRGRLSYDGGLDDLVRRARPEKQVILRFGAPVDRRLLDALGVRVVTHDHEGAVLQVEGSAMKQLVAGAMATLPVIDLTVEAPPLEEVISDLFTKPEARA